MKVTHELYQSIIAAGCLPPRHARGCPKNEARMLPTLLAAKGKSITEIRAETWRVYEAKNCTCEAI